MHLYQRHIVITADIIKLGMNEDSVDLVNSPVLVILGGANSDVELARSSPGKFIA